MYIENALYYSTDGQLRDISNRLRATVSREVIASKSSCLPLYIYVQVYSDIGFSMPVVTKICTGVFKYRIDHSSVRVLWGRGTRFQISLQEG